MLAASLISTDRQGSQNKKLNLEMVAGEILEQNLEFSKGKRFVGTIQGIGQGEFANIVALPGERYIGKLKLMDMIPVIQDDVWVGEGATFYLEGLENGTYTLLAYIVNMSKDPPEVSAQSTQVVEIGDDLEISVVIEL